MPTWTIQSKTQTAKNRQQKVVWIFNNGFYIELCELEELQYPERQAFINSIQQNKLPVALLKSSNYPGDDVDYCFEDRQKEYGVTLAWRNYESEQVELKEYDPEWPNLYQQEYKKIVNSLQIEKYGSRDQPLLLEMEHIGSTSVEGMGAKPIIDILMIRGNPRDGCGPTTFNNTIDNLINMGYNHKHGKSWLSLSSEITLVKKGFIIHVFQCFCGEHPDDSNFIVLREYLRTHPDARDKYNEFKKRLISNACRITIKEYASEKNWFVNGLLNKAVHWYRQYKNYIHVGDLNEVKNQWSCCKASKDEKSTINEDMISEVPDYIGCYQPGLEKDSYHPGRYYNTAYNFVRGWWTCCFQGRESNGCVKLRLLANGDALLTDCEKWGINSACRWVKSLKDINKDYSDNFHEQGVNGHLLLTLIDDAVLQDLGVPTVLHRKIILKAINELKESS